MSNIFIPSSILGFDGRDDLVQAVDQRRKLQRLDHVAFELELAGDQRLDRVWDRLAPNFALTLIRDRAYLQWRYADNPFHAYTLLGLYFMGRLLGWAVVQPDHPRLRVVDLLIARRWLKPALAALTRHAAITGLGRVEIWLPGSWQNGVKQPSQATGIVTTQFRNWRGIPLNETARDLYYTMGDLDIF